MGVEMQACRVTGDGKAGGIQGPRGSCPCRQNNPGDFLMCLVPGDVEEGRREPSLASWHGLLVDWVAEF